MAEQSQHEVTTAHTVRAERFELVDTTGAVRATLGTDENGQVSVTLFDQDGRRRASLAADRAGTGLRLFTASGTTALLLATSSQVALVAVQDDAGHPAVILGVGPDGQRGVSLCDRAGARRMTLGLDPEGYPAVVLEPTAESSRLLLTVRPDGDAGLAIRDREGSTRAILLVDAHGQAALALLDPEERPIARLELTHDRGPQLDFFGPNQGLAWRAPEGD